MLAALFTALGAHAQSPQDVGRALQQNQQIQQQQQQLERQQREQEEQRRRTPSGKELTPQAPAPAAAGPCTQVREIVLEGATRLEPVEQARLAAPYLDHCLSLADVNRLIADITNRYVALGYVTTRVYLPAQDLSGGRLLLKVVEGKVQSLVIKPAESANAGTAFPGLEGSMLNLRDIEQGLDQVNRLGSNDARVDIEPGDEPGQSRVVIHNAPRKRTLASASVDNSGLDSTGREQYTAFLGADNLAGMNDYLSGTVRYSSAGGHEYSQSAGAYGSVPYGYWTYSAALNAFEYASLVQGSVSTFATGGSTDSQMVRAERVVYRDQALKWTLGGGLTLKQTENTIAGVPIDLSSADLTVLDLASSLGVIAGGMLMTFDVGVSEGVDAFGATVDDPTRPAGAPRAQYEKLTYGASLLAPFRVGGAQGSWRSTLYGQASNDPLYGTEQIAIGNLYTVRGFRTTSLASRTGYYLRNEVGVQLPQGQALFRPYLAFDVGSVDAGGTLQGWAVGLDVSLAGASLQVAYAAPVSVPNLIRKESGWLYARLAYTY
ncbi:MAG: ShlB/FhaC/HecB family hemolysin secretion/activation protein [Burkholderiales bacterium]